MSERLTIQYIDELLCSWNRETYTKDSIYLGSTFAEKEKKSFKEKLQFCQNTVHYFGPVLPNKGNMFSPNRLKIIQMYPRHLTK